MKETSLNSENHREVNEEDLKIIEFLDSIDSYLNLFDALSSALRQGWLDLASARHSMGSSRISSTYFDYKPHSAATTLQVTELHDKPASAESMVNQPQFSLSRWASPDDQNCCPKVVEFDDNHQKKSYSPQLRHRAVTNSFGEQEKVSQTDEALLTVDEQVQKERAKLLSVFGALVSPKLRGAQVSFEKALEILVQIANARSSILSAYSQIKQNMENMK